MIRLVLRRVAAGAVTLLLLSLLIFAGSRVLPGDVGRSILGPLADPASVAALNHQLGADLPWYEGYANWVGRAAMGDLGQSYLLRSPAAPLVVRAAVNSAKLALVALLIVVPLAVVAGVYAATRAGRWQDRAIGTAGLALTVVPEFVSGVVLILVVAVWLRWLPLSATAPAGAGGLEQLRHLILPALPLAIVLFGYIARITRAGTVAALEADYTRTATLKGLPRRVVIGRHVLRNALLPTVTVVAAQAGYLVGGLVVVETLFRYGGLGSLILEGARSKDLPMLEAGVLVAGTAIIVMNLVADIATAALDPRQRA